MMRYSSNKVYVCRCCAHRFTQPMTELVPTGVYFPDTGEEERETVLKCPVCGMGEPELIGVCDECGDEMEADGSELCRKCKEKVRRSFREYLLTLTALEVACLDDLLDGVSVTEV